MAVPKKPSTIMKDQEKSKIHDVIVDLYLQVKIRSNEEVSKI